MAVSVTCTRCKATGDGPDPIHAKFELVHDKGCGPKIGILEWSGSKSVAKAAPEKTAKETIEAELEEAKAQLKAETEAEEKPKKKSKKKKASD